MDLYSSLLQLHILLSRLQTLLVLRRRGGVEEHNPVEYLSFPIVDNANSTIHMLTMESYGI